MVYGPIQAGLYGACEGIYPVHSGDKPCGNCGENERAPADWLCERCRVDAGEFVGHFSSCVVGPFGFDPILAQIAPHVNREGGGNEDGSSPAFWDQFRHISG